MNLSNKTKKVLTWLVTLLSIACIVVAIVVPIVVINQRKNQYKYHPDVASQAYTNPTEEYINKNEMSLMFASTPKLSFLTTVRRFMANLFEKSDELNVLDFGTIIKPQVASITSGTSWMFDYQIDTDAEKQNLVTYYLATNIHVLNLSYTLIYDFRNGDEISLQIPINSTTTQSVAAYISQPQGYYQNQQQNYFAPVSNDPQFYPFFWYQLPNFNVASASSDLIPLGALHNNTTSQDNYFAQFTYKNAQGQSQQFMVKETTSGDEKGYQFVPLNLTATNQTNSQDFGLIKTTISNPSEIMPPQVNQISEELDISDREQVEENVKRGFANIQNIFKVENTNFSQNNPLDNTYITKLNYLKSLANSKVLTKQNVEDIFMFANMETQSNDTQISVAGFPGGNNSQTGIAYNYYNGATVTKSDVEPVGSFGINRDTIQYYYNGKLMSGKYFQQDNYTANGVNLLPGSSGSMVVNSNGQILGIYWGIVSISANNTNLGMITPIYTSNSSTNLLLKYYQYQKAMNKTGNSTALTSLLEAINQLYNPKTIW